MSPGGAVVRAAVVGLCLGAALCYCVYKVVRRDDTKKKQQRGGDGGRRLSIRSKVSGIRVKDSIQGKAAVESENLPQSASDLQPCHLKKLIEIVASSSDSSLRIKALITLGNSAAFTINNDIIRNLNGIRFIGAAISDVSSDVRIKALNALNNLSLNIQNQEKIKDLLPVVCETIISAALDSELQLAGLRLLINMSVFNNHHQYLVDHIPFFLTLLAEGNTDTQICTSKVLVNLSLNSSLTTVLLRCKAPQALNTLFYGDTNKELLVRVLTLSVNIYGYVGMEQNSKRAYDEDSLHTLMLGDSSPLRQNLISLLQHPELEVKNQVVKLILICKSKGIKYSPRLTDIIVNK